MLVDDVVRELPEMRRHAESLMVDTCVRRRYTSVAVDDYGIPTSTVTEVSLPCRKVPAPGTEDSTDRNVQTHEAAFLFPYDTDIEGSDELLHDGVIWQVIGPPLSQSLPVRLRVLARRSEAL